MKISVLPPSGFRDFLPLEALDRIALVEGITKIYLSYGFQPIQMPFLENLSTLQGKGGGADNEKLIFKVLKRGEDLERSLGQKEDLADMGLRFDLTLPLARYCARFKEQLPKPFKVFQIGPVWRADRPQKGRFREFYQCDVDIIGAKEIGSEVDCMSAILEVFDFFGLEGVELHLNDRRLLSAILKEANIPAENHVQTLIILDKLDKIGPEGIAKELTEKLGTTPEGIIKLFSATHHSLDSFEHLDKNCIDGLRAIIEIFAKMGKKIIFNPTLVRGQDYYTETIFEIRHKNLSGSLGGGGRYNRLLEVFGSAETPAFGGSIGFERLYMLLQEAKKTEASNFSPHVFIPLFDANMRDRVSSLAANLRMRGIRVDVYPDAAKLKNQMKYADDRKIPFTLFLGEDEWKSGQVKLKDMFQRTEEIVSLTDLPNKLELLCKK